MNETPAQSNTNVETHAKIIYVLYLVSIIIGVTGLVGVVMAYIYIDDAPDWLKTHYRFQIRTFWIGALYMLIGFILSFILIGYLVFLFVLVWLIVRCIKGIKSLDEKKAYPDPTGWML